MALLTSAVGDRTDISRSSLEMALPYHYSIGRSSPVHGSRYQFVDLTYSGQEITPIGRVFFKEDDNMAILEVQNPRFLSDSAKIDLTRTLGDKGIELVLVIPGNPGSYHQRGIDPDFEDLSRAA